VSTHDDFTLTAGDAQVTVSPGNGGRITSLKAGGVELLRQGERYGSFPMAPWCGRIRDGRFRDGGTVRQMPLNAAPHAIHGTARDHAWNVARREADEAVITLDLTDPWPYPARITQVFALTGDALTLTMAIEAHESSFPAQLGWHPWFNRRLDGAGGDTEAGGDTAEGARIEFAPDWQEERGEDHLPTGNRLEKPLPGPWDDCFGMTRGVDVTLVWPGRMELKVTSPEKWVVVYDEQDAAVCVEPQTGPPNGLNTTPRLVTPLEPLEATTTWSWRTL
jgi:aldose 1-epimerase